MDCIFVAKVVLYQLFDSSVARFDALLDRKYSCRRGPVCMTQCVLGGKLGLLSVGLANFGCNNRFDECVQKFLASLFER